MVVIMMLFAAGFPGLRQSVSSRTTALSSGLSYSIELAIASQLIELIPHLTALQIWPVPFR